MRFSETLRGVIILGFGFGPPFCIIWFLFERLETLVKEGYNPTIQLATLLSQSRDSQHQCKFFNGTPYKQFFHGYSPLHIL